MTTADPLKQITARLCDRKVSPHACLIICPDTIRQGRVVERIRGALSATAEIKKIDAAITSEETLKKIFFSLQNSSLFCSETHVIISNIDAFSAPVAKTLLLLIKESAPSTIVIASALKLASNLALHKFFDQSQMLFSLPELIGIDFERWVSKELIQSGITEFPPATPGVIRQASQSSPDAAYDIIQKIALYLDGSPLTINELKELIPVEGRVDEFDFISKIATTTRPRLELMISQLLNQGVSPFPLLGLLHRNYTTYHALNQLLKSGLSPEQSAGMVNSPPWLVKKIAPLALRYSTSDLRLCLGAIARADSLLKNRSLGPESIMSELLETLAP